MPRQVVPNNIKEKHSDIIEPIFNTLLIDGSNVLEYSFRGYKKLNSEGKEVGGIFQFLLQIKILLQKANFRYVYVFWDGDKSGQLRRDKYSQYKENRDKDYDDNELSDYMKAVDAKINKIKQYNTKNKVVDETKLKEKELFFLQRDILMKSLDELCIRQCMCNFIEADDFIGYYVANKKKNERIVICSNDRDLMQLISNDVIVYAQSIHDFINTKNYTLKFGIYYENVLLKKMICGDSSDNIKGIKGVGEKTLETNFPMIKERKCTLNEIIDGAKTINNKRIENKKPPLKWANNIINKVTDGVQGDKIYEINEVIIDLKHPLMTDEGIELMNDIMYAPMDCTDRSLINLYNILNEYKIEELLDENKFSSFFLEFKYLINNELNNK